MEKRTPLIWSLILMIVLGLGFFLPASGQEKVKPEAAPGEMKPFTVVRFVVAKGVENKEPVDVAETFPVSTEKVYCFLEAAGITMDTEVSFVWFHGQNEMRKITLPLGMGSRWRTYAYKNLVGLRGDWRVEIRDQGGKVLQEAKFKVE